MADGHPTDNTITNADNIYVGSARSPFYRNGYRGVLWPHVMFTAYGAIATATATGIAVQQTATIATNLTATGSLVTAGVATFDVARAPSLTATGDVSAVTFTFTGTDTEGRTVKASMAGPNTNTVVGLVAFKTISNVAVSAGWATTLKVDVGSSSAVQFPFRVNGKVDVHSISQDGKPETTLTLAPALAVATTPTASTADTRGLWTPNTAFDGTKVWNAVYRVDHTDDVLAFGATPFAG